MGAEPFTVTALGTTQSEAFVKAVTDAQWEHGHGGYTGTIAEKHDFFFVGTTKGLTLNRIHKLIWDQMDPYRTAKPIALPAGMPKMTPSQITAADDKWGAAGCYAVSGKAAAETKAAMGRKGTRDKVYVFFGWASS